MKFLFTIILLLLIALSSCSQKEDSCCSKLSAGDDDTPAVPAIKTAATGTLTDMSLFHLDSDWQTQQGETIKLNHLQGKTQLVAMVYTRCSYACPRIIADLKRIEESVAHYKPEELGIVLVTMDPDYDTPARLKKFAADNKLNANRWLMLTSSHDNIRELAALLSMKYKTEPDGEISHSNIISVMNASGEIIHQAEGLGVDPDETVKSINGLLRGI